MTRIGLLSDTHGYLDQKIREYFSGCDEIWHAGDLGDMAVANELKQIKTLRAVYGNIDGTPVRIEFPAEQKFLCEKVGVLMTHIGGPAGKYPPEIRDMITGNKPQLFICGHTHILQVQYLPGYKMLHMNPGAAGHFGQQKVRTILRFEIDGEKIQNLEVIELGKKE